jgi:sporulation protein YlmC with PRC-barrel domain
VVRVLMAAVLTAAFAAAVLVLYTQTSATSETLSETSRGFSELSQVRASKLLGSPVYNARNTKIGEVKELVLNRDGKVSAVIVDVAFIGLGDKYVAVKMSDISISNNHLTLDRTSDQLQQMASYKLEDEDDGAGTSSPNSGGRLIILPAH